MRSGKGQQSIELLVAFSTVMAIFLVLYFIFTYSYGDSSRRSLEAGWGGVSDGIAQEISLAAVSGDGYVRKFHYPRVLDGALNYSILVNNASGSVDITVESGPGMVFTHSAPTLTRAIVGEDRYAVENGFMMEKGRGYAFVENRNGTVYVVQMRVG